MERAMEDHAANGELGTIDDKDLPQDQIKRVTKTKQLKIPRWLTKKVGLYDLDYDNWSAIDVKMELPFFPFSTTVYLPENEVLVIGGLND